MPLRTALQRLVPFRLGKPSLPLTLLRAAARHGCPVQLFFLGQQRQMENIGCRITKVDKHGLVLLHAGLLCPVEELERALCSIYFRLPLSAHLLLPGLSRARAHEGFLCQTRIMGGVPQPDGTLHLHLRLPDNILQRELRRHQRQFISPECVEELALWLPWDKPDTPLPAVASASFRAHAGQSRLQLVNLSAGGAKVQIDMVEFTEELANMDLKQALVRLRLHALHAPQPDCWLRCRCVESRYNISLRRLVLRLCFAHYREVGSAGWIEVGEQGAPGLQPWFARDYPGLAEGLANRDGSGQDALSKDALGQTASGRPDQP